MTKLIANSVGKRSRSIPTTLWLGMLVASGCSLKSLDHLQQGQPKEGLGDSTAAGRGSTAGPTTGNGIGGGAQGTLMGGTTAGGASAMDSSTATALASGGASLSAGAVGGADLGQGGAASHTETSTTAIAAGGVGSTNTSSVTSGGSIEGGSASMATSALGGTISASGGTVASTGSISAEAGAGGTGGVSTPAMSYNVLNQSCTNGLECPGGGSCCEQIEIPAAKFTMGTDKTTDPDAVSEETPSHSATVDRFFMDKFEVTVGRFRRFVQAYDGTKPPLSSGAHPKIPDSGWQLGFDDKVPATKGELKTSLKCDANFQTWTDTAGVRDNMPVNCVNWYVAFAFCIWDKGRLPTEAEWEMAASGGTLHRRYPWGSTTPDPSKHAAMSCAGDGAGGCASSDLLAVGSRTEGANAWGNLDLAGNLWEWTLDYFDGTYYSAVGECTNCGNLAEPTPKTIRGGSFYEDAKKLRATYRTSKAADNRSPYTGFRCVRTP